MRPSEPGLFAPSCLKHPSSAQCGNEDQHDGDASEDAEGDDDFFVSLLVHNTTGLVFEKPEHYASSSNLKKRALFRKRCAQLSAAKRKAWERGGKEIYPLSPSPPLSLGQRMIISPEPFVAPR